MKILQINAVYRYASTGRTCEELHDYLKEHGIECVTAYGERKGDFEDTVYIGNRLDQKLHALFSRITGKIGYFSVCSTLAFLKYVDDYKPDIIQIRNIHSNFIHIPMLLSYCAKRNIPTIINLHDCFWFTGKCCHYTLDKCQKWKTECGHCRIYKKWNKVWFFDRTRKMLKDKERLFGSIPNLAVIGVAKWVVDEAKSGVVFKKASKIDCIYNWVDLSVFQPTSSSIREDKQLQDKFVILCIASVLDDSKGLPDMIEVAKRLPQDTRMLLVGDVHTEEKLPENMILYGKTESKKELAQIYSCADVLLQLSMEETCSKVMIESISCGTPIVVYESTCGPELAADGCGIVVNYDNGFDAVVDAVMTVKENGKNFYEENCRKKACEFFNLQTNGRKYIELYKSLIESKKNG